jgi:adenylate kinase
VVRIGLFGLPGAGKGTQAARIAKHFSIPHIGTGDIFRELQKGESKLALELRAILSSGQLVPDEMVTKITFERLKNEDCRSGFLLDGYPRTLTQAQALDASEHRLEVLLSIDVEKAEIIRRLSGRRVCKSCNSVYSSALLGDACPKDGGVLIQRDDDKAEAVNTRLMVFEKNQMPVVSFFESRGILHHIDGNGSEDEVFARALRVIEKVCA